MELIITIVKAKNTYETAQKIHEKLVGNRAYIESDICLSFENSEQGKSNEICLFVDVDSCRKDLNVKKVLSDILKDVIE